MFCFVSKTAKLGESAGDECLTGQHGDLSLDSPTWYNPASVVTDACITRAGKAATDGSLELAAQSGLIGNL